MARTRRPHPLLAALLLATCLCWLAFAALSAQAGTAAPARGPAGGRLVRAADGQLYEDLDDGSRVLRTTLRVQRNGVVEEVPVTVTATPIDRVRRDAPPADSPPAVR